MTHLTLIDYISVGWVSIGLILTVIAIIRDSRIQKKIQNSIYNHYQNNDMKNEEKYGYTRKELVDWVRGMYQDMDEENKKDAERFFPELVESESEDEKIMNDIMVAVENSRLPYERIEEIRFYLNNQKEQKPADWCEEDDALIENVCTALKGYALHERKVDLYEHAHRLEEMSERLKSLRPKPHWKPKEQ